MAVVSVFIVVSSSVRDNFYFVESVYDKIRKADDMTGVVQI